MIIFILGLQNLVFSLYAITDLVLFLYFRLRPKYIIDDYCSCAKIQSLKKIIKITNICFLGANGIEISLICLSCFVNSDEGPAR